MRQTLADVGPEFFDDIRKCVAGNHEAQLFTAPRPRIQIRGIGIRDSNRDGVAQKFRIVKDRPAPIVFRDDNLRDGAEESRREFSCADSEISWILMEKDRHESFAEHVSGDLVRRGVSVLIREAGDSRSILASARCHKHKEPRRHIGRPVEGIVSGDTELLLVRQRREGNRTIHCSIIRQNSEQTFVAFRRLNFRDLVFRRFSFAGLAGSRFRLRAQRRHREKKCKDDSDT
jgi:hypothetical protein